MPYPVIVYPISDPSARQNAQELIEQGNRLVVKVDENETVGSFKRRVADEWQPDGRYYGISEEDWPYRRFDTAEILRGNDDALLLDTLRSLTDRGSIKYDRTIAVVYPPVAPDVDNVEIVREMDEDEAYEEGTAESRANAAFIHGSDSESEDDGGPPQPKRQRRVNSEEAPNQETPGGVAQDDEEEEEEEAAVKRPVPEASAGAEGAARGNGGGPVPEAASALGTARGGDDVPQGADVNNEERVDEAQAAPEYEEGRNGVNEDAGGGGEEEDMAEENDHDDGAGEAAAADDEAVAPVPGAAGPPLLLWLRGLEVDGGTAPGRFERYAPDFLEHFGSLRSLALAADEPDGMEGIFRDCGVTARGDKAEIRWAINRLPRPE